MLQDVTTKMRLRDGWRVKIGSIMTLDVRTKKEAERAQQLWKEGKIDELVELIGSSEYPPRHLT